MIWMDGRGRLLEWYVTEQQLWVGPFVHVIRWFRASNQSYWFGDGFPLWPKKPSPPPAAGAVCHVTAHRCAGDGIAVPCSPPWQGSEAASLAAGHPAFAACLPACLQQQASLRKWTKAHCRRLPCPIFFTSSKVNTQIPRKKPPVHQTWLHSHSSC